MNKPLLWSLPLGLAVLCIYFFVTAPQPLPDTPTAAMASGGIQIPIKTVFEIIAAENDAVRSMYTREIVGKGKKQGLKFDENWRDVSVHAGPLPALFLRETAGSVSKSPVPLGLFLGSDFPISPSNKFNGLAATKFQEIKETGEPRYFFAEDTKRHTAMFPDYASVTPCVSCHNEHAESPKTDWEIGDTMGATTWSYPKDTVTFEEMTEILGALRKGYRDTYESYLKEVSGFENPPPVGEKWPRDGYFLPSSKEFAREMEALASAGTVTRILAIKSGKK